MRAAELAAFALLLYAGTSIAEGAALSASQAEELINNLLAASTPVGGLTCSFNITGNFTKAAPSNTTGSTNVANAALNCTGGTLRIVGGPALKPFEPSFSGVEYTLDYGLPGATVTIRDQSLVLGYSNLKNLTPNGEASLVLINSNVTVQTANFSSNKQATAGAIRANDSSNIAIFNSTFLNNTGAIAGAVSVFNSSLFINGSTFIGNKGQQGGGVLFQNGTGSTVYIASSVFSRNNATTGGGAFAQDCRRAILYNNVFQMNQARGSGGGIFQLDCPGSIVLNAVLKNNATAGGGAYLNSLQSLNLEFNEWSHNSASVGSGGVDLQSVQKATISNDTFSQNKGQQGGGYFGTATSCSITSCTFSANNATLNGGAIFRTQGSGDVALCLFESNYAKKYGGAIYDSQVSGAITENVFSRNGAGSPGGSALFRLQSAGIAQGNSGLDSSNFVNQLPNTTSIGVAG